MIRSAIAYISPHLITQTWAIVGFYKLMQVSVLAIIFLAAHLDDGEKRLSVILWMLKDIFYKKKEWKSDSGTMT